MDEVHEKLEKAKRRVDKAIKHVREALKNPNNYEHHATKDILEELEHLSSRIQFILEQ